MWSSNFKLTKRGKKVTKYIFLSPTTYFSNHLRNPVIEDSNAQKAIA